jgi:hypothetical protein
MQKEFEMLGFNSFIDRISEPETRKTVGTILHLPLSHHEPEPLPSTPPKESIDF